MVRRLSKFLFVLVACLSQPAWAIDVQEVKTSSGLSAWLVEDYHVPVIEVVIAFKGAGSASDVAGKEGRATMLAQMLTEGTKQQTSQRFHKMLEEDAIQLSINASQDAVLVSMKTLSENRERAFSLMAEAILDPRFAEDKLNEVKSRMTARLRRLQSSPNYLASRKWQELSYSNHPYGMPGLGTVASIDGLMRPDFEAFHATHFTKENAVIAVVGAITHRELKSMLGVYLADLPKRFKPDEVIEEATVLDNGIKEQVVIDVPQSVVVFGTQGVKRTDPDFYAAYVMNHILGGSGLSARLGKVVRKEHGLTYHIGTDLVPYQYGAAWLGSFATRADEVDKALDLTKRTIARMAAEGVTQKEVDEAIGYITGSFPLNIDRNGAIANYLISMQMYGLGKDYLDRRNELFKAVTLEQVNRVAQKLLYPAKFVVVEAGPQKNKK